MESQNKTPIGYFQSEFISSKIITVFYIFFLTGTISIYSAYNDCFPSEMGKSKNNFPDSVSVDTLFKITGISPNICGITMRKWPHGENLYVVYSEDKLEFKIHILQKVNNQFIVISEYTEQLDDYRFREFDFAAYTIGENTTAMGIRFFARGPTMGGSWECIRLKLFEFTDNHLRLVLSALVDYNAEGNSVAYDIDTYYSNSESAVIVIGKPDASGYNSIIKKTDDSKYIYYYYKGTMYSEDIGSGYPGNLRDNCFCP